MYLSTGHLRARPLASVGNLRGAVVASRATLRLLIVAMAYMPPNRPLSDSKACPAVTISMLAANFGNRS